MHVRFEVHGTGLEGVYDKVKQAVRLETGTGPHVLRQVMIDCRKGGHVSIPGVYVGVVDKIPMGIAL